MANDCIPLKRPGQDVTGYCTAAVTGKQCVQITADRAGGLGGLGGLATATDGTDLWHVGHPNAAGAAGAAKRVFGVAKYDAALGKTVGVITSGAIVPIKTSGAISAGAQVEVAANGTIITLAAGIAIGMALADAGSGEDCEVLLW